MLKRARSFLAKLGPGLITGASDDDPSGILTYLQAGTVLGFRALWTALATLPLMYGIQEMCARLGLVTGKGLTRLLRERYSPWLLYPVALVSVSVITVNIGADLAAIGTVLERLLGGSRLVWLAGAAALIVLSLIYTSYHRFARVMKWLTLSLGFYVATVFVTHLDWAQAAFVTFVPSLPSSRTEVLLVAAILGTTISPYLFFWQANEEVEEREEETRTLQSFTVTKHELKFLKEDVFLGMLASNAVQWFIIAGASQLAMSRGVGELVSFEQAAQVLQPLLGQWAYLAFSFGIIGTGLLAIPVLAGSVGYILAEVFALEEGLNKTYREAKGFYLTIALATLVGATLSFLKVDPIQLLIYTAVLYTLITPPLILIILRLSNDKQLMGGSVNRWPSNVLGILALIAMTAAAVAYLWL